MFEGHRPRSAETQRSPETQRRIEMLQAEIKFRQKAMYYFPDGIMEKDYTGFVDEITREPLSSDQEKNRRLAELNSICEEGGMLTSGLTFDNLLAFTLRRVAEDYDGLKNEIRDLELQIDGLLSSR